MDKVTMSGLGHNAWVAFDKIRRDRYFRKIDEIVDWINAFEETCCAAPVLELQKMKNKRKGNPNGPPFYE